MTAHGLSAAPPREAAAPPAELRRRVMHALDVERTEAVQRVIYHQQAAPRIRVTQGRDPTPGELHEAFARESWWAQYIHEIDALRLGLERREVAP